MSTKLGATSPLFSQTAVVATVTTPVTTVLLRDNIGYVVTWTNGSGTPTGNFYVQVQNNTNDPWDNLGFGVLGIALSGNSGSHTINLNQLPYTFVRIQYVPTAGQVDISISITTKKIGG